MLPFRSARTLASKKPKSKCANICHLLNSSIVFWLSSRIQVKPAVKIYAANKWILVLIEKLSCDPIYDRCELSFRATNLKTKKKIFFSFQELAGKIMKFECDAGLHVACTWACHQYVSLSFFTITFSLRSVLSRFRGCVSRCRCFGRIYIFWINWASPHAICHLHDLWHIYACPPEQRALPNETWELC